jgi:hypothetical protein
MCTCFCDLSLWISNTKLWKLHTYLCFVLEGSVRRNRIYVVLYCAECVWNEVWK